MSDKPAEHALVAAAAERVFGSTSSRGDFETLEGGTGRRSVALSIDRERVVAKIPESGSGSTIAPREEFELLGRLAARDLTARPLGHDAPTGVTFSLFLTGSRAWSRADAGNPVNLERVAARLRELHAIPATVRAFDPIAFARTYRAAASAADAPSSARSADELEQLAQVLARIDERAVLCHNDLIAANVLDDGTIRFIDFEYAAAAPPIVDLASLAAMNELGAEARRRLVEAYYAGSAVPWPLRVFDQIVKLQQLIARLWAYAQQTN